MFNSLFAEEAGHSNQEKSEGGPSSSSAEASASGPANPLLNLWNVATAVTSTVKARADELVKSVVDTDWRSELSQFSREVGEESKTLKDKTAELVEHLPEQVVHLPEKAEEALTHLPTQVHLPKDVGQTLEGVGSALSLFGKSLLLGTKELIDELKEGVETEIAAASKEGKRSARKATAGSASKLSAVQAKYNRFEAEVAAMQRDSSTYCDEPEEAEDYGRWTAGFSLDGVRAEISRITAENAFMAELQSRLVPIIVEHEDFWRRYFYRLHKLQQKEEQRQQLAQRAKTLQEDEVPLGWGDEDEAPPSVASPSGDQISASPDVLVPPPSAKAPQAQQPTEPAADVPGKAEEVAAGVPPPEATAAVSSAAGPSKAAVGKSTNAASLAASAVAATAAAATVPSPPTAEASVELIPSATGSKVHSAGGASEPGSTSAHVDVDPGQLESEPHAETASDSSTKEWCVVTSETKPSTCGSGDMASPGAGGSASRTAVQSNGEKALALGPIAESAPSTPAAGPGGAVAAVPDAQAAAGVATVADDKASAAPAAKSGAKGPAKAGDDEEVDEDWGNWD